MVIFIYSRKSKWTGRGDSVENQITMCREYINHNIENTADAEIIEYEDEGYSGKDTHRPKFQQMMSDISTRHCDFLVCYKLDRLGRNIADLANLIEFLNKEQVSFISIKERFDTSTPIGKAMLYFAGVLAQMEREQIAERVRDNMILLARKGRWLGGNTPLGFSARGEEKVTINGKTRKSYRLVVNEGEIATVKFIFRKYLEYPSLVHIVRCFLELGILTKRGKEYTITGIRDILTNPVYCTADKTAYDYYWSLGCQVCLEEWEADGSCGFLSYAKTTSVKYKSQDNEPEKWIISRGIHPGIISGEDFVRVQNLLCQNSSKGAAYRKVQNPVALLSGLLYCSCGHLMRPKNYAANKQRDNDTRRFSYLCPCKEITHGENCKVSNVQGNELDKLVSQAAVDYTEEHLSIKMLQNNVAKKLLLVKEDNVSDEAILEQEILKKKSEIKALISAIGKCNGKEGVIQQIEEEIAKLSYDFSQLQQKKDSLNSLKSNTGRPLDDAVRLARVEEQLSSFQGVFNLLTVVEKRECLRMLVEKIVWDGKEAHIYIRPIITTQ